MVFGAHGLLEGDDDFLEYEDDSDTEQLTCQKDSSFGGHFDTGADTEEEDRHEDDDDDFVIRSKANKRPANRRKQGGVAQLSLGNRFQQDDLSLPLSISTAEETFSMTVPSTGSADGELLTLQSPDASLALPPSPESPSPVAPLDPSLSEVPSASVS